jgi:hypothetical protein
MKTTYHKTKFSELPDKMDNKFIAVRNGVRVGFRSATGIWIQSGHSWQIGPRVSAKVANYGAPKTFIKAEKHW